MKNYLLIFFLCVTFNKAQSAETKIVHIIQNEIITNVDIKNEFKYLVALNNSLKELDKKQKQFFEEMSDHQNFRPAPNNSDKSFFEKVKDMFS